MAQLIARRLCLVLGLLLLFLVTLGMIFHDTLSQRLPLPRVGDWSNINPAPASSDYTDDASTDPISRPKLHILMAANRAAVDMCKTLLTGAMLGYPAPTVLAWGEVYDKDLVGGGSHIAKITMVADYLDAMGNSTDDDLAIMMDAYDIWFQLPIDVLISRYHSINARANQRLASRLGRAFEAEGISQRVIFAGEKRCAPNQLQTLACYPIPDSPQPDDLYGTNTGTAMGKDQWSSHKARYLNSGLAIGPRKDMRRVFRRAAEMVDAAQARSAWDNGSGGTKDVYHGSDQSIFATIFGEQEYQREVMRRRHLTPEERRLGKDKPTPHQVEGAIVADPLNPAFTHEPGHAKKGHPDEFGIGVDHFADLIKQTMHAEEDVRILVYGKNVDEQLKERKGMFDCPSRVTGRLAQDILDVPPPVTEPWDKLPLASNLCANTVPVMLHHNGDKGARAWQWPRTWMQPHARRLFKDVVSKRKPRKGAPSAGGIYLPAGKYLDWKTLCPANYEYELFRDVPQPKVAPPPA